MPVYCLIAGNFRNKEKKRSENVKRVFSIVTLRFCYLIDHAEKVRPSKYIQLLKLGLLVVFGNSLAYFTKLRDIAKYIFTRTVSKCFIENIIFFSPI